MPWSGGERTFSQLMFCLAGQGPGRRASGVHSVRSAILQFIEKSRDSSGLHSTRCTLGYVRVIRRRDDGHCIRRAQEALFRLKAAEESEFENSQC